MNKYRAWWIKEKEMHDVTILDFKHEQVHLLADDTVPLKEVILMQSTGLFCEVDLEEIWYLDLLEVESPKGKFIAKVVKEAGTFGIVAIKGHIVDYFEDHWNDDFMPLIDIYWNENGDDDILSKTKRLGTSFENPELLKEVE